MPQSVEIEGVGTVEFPDDATESDILDAASQLAPQAPETPAEAQAKKRSRLGLELEAARQEVGPITEAIASDQPLVPSPTPSQGAQLASPIGFPGLVRPFRQPEGPVSEVIHEAGRTIAEMPSEMTRPSMLPLAPLSLAPIPGAPALRHAIPRAMGLYFGSQMGGAGLGEVVAGIEQGEPKTIGRGLGTMSIGALVLPEFIRALPRSTAAALEPIPTLESIQPLEGFMSARVQPGERAGLAIPTAGELMSRPGLPTQPKLPPVVVPETVAEARETVIESIRKANATTLSQIQALFPEARLSREQARVFRNLAFPPVVEPVRPQATVAEVLGKPPEEPPAGGVAVPKPPTPTIGGPENAPIQVRSAETQVRGMPSQPVVNEGVLPAEEGAAGIPRGIEAEAAAGKPEVSLTDPVGNAPEFYSLPRLRALERSADPRVAAAKKFYGAKTIPDLARLAKARFEEMDKARTIIREPESYQPPKPPAEPTLTPEEQAAAQRQLEEEVPAAEPVAKPPEPAVAPAEVPAAKEPWQLTRADFLARETGYGEGHRPYPRLVEVQKASIEAALREGKPVPSEVLADYPDLKPATPPPVAEAKAKDLAQVGDEVNWTTGAGDKARSTVQRISKYPNDPEPMADVDWFGVKRVPVSKLDIIKKSSRRIFEEERAAKAALPPTKAVDKVATEVRRVARTEGKRSAKDVKAELVARLEQAVKDAPETFDAASSGKVTIEIPGDGTFTVWNSKANLQGLLDRANRIKTTPIEPTRKLPTSKETADAEAAVQIYGSPEQAYRTIKRQIESLEDADVIARAEALLPRIYELTKASKFEAEADLARTNAKSKSEVVEDLGKQLVKLQKAKRPDKRRIEELSTLIENYRKDQNTFQQAADKAAAAEHAERVALGLEPGPTEPRPGPGAASPSEFAERTAKGAGAEPPSGPPQVTLDAGTKPTPEVARRAKDFNLFNKANTGQWSFYFGKLGPAAKSAWEKMALTAFKIRESVGRDVKRYVDDLLTNLPRPVRAKGGKVFFDALDGKPIDKIEAEWTGKPNGDAVIAAAKEVKGRLEEIRVTIRDAKREAYHGFLMGLDRDTLAQLFDKNISHAVDTSKYTKDQFADALTRSELPDDWGISDGSYLTHLFTGDWKITAKRGDTPEFVTRAKTVSEAKAKVFKYVKDNPDYANAEWKIEQDTVIPADMIRLGDRRFWQMVKQMKDNLGVTASEVKQAQQGIIGRKSSKQKWFGSLQQRRGFQGYSHDYKQTMTSYLSGFHRWLELSKLQREAQPLIEEVRREGRTSAAEQLDIIMDNMWGKPAQSTVLFDNFIREIPGVRDYIKPLALDRWSRNIKSAIPLLTLKTLRFAVFNRLQPLGGLYPLVGERIFAQAKLRRYTKEGRALLDEAGVRFDPGQYGNAGIGLSKIKNISEQFSGERNNQETAFLAMYQHGTESGLPHAEAINYAKLRGQLLTQFTPIIPDIPPIMRGPITSLLFQFKRFPIKQAELLFKMAADRNFGGIARWLGVMAAAGGLSYFMKQLLVPSDKRERLRRTITDQYGQAVADAVMYGAPSLLNIDLSGSLVLGDEPFGSNIYEKMGRQVAGPSVSMTAETIRNMLTSPRESTTALQKTVDTLRRFPTLKPLAELIAWEQSDLDVRTPDGETKYRKSLKDVLASMGSFRTANEANMQSAVNAIVELKKQTTQLKNDAYVALMSEGGNAQSALDAIQKFNERWPEVAISGKELNEYIHARSKGAGKTDYERLAGKKFAPLLP